MDPVNWTNEVRLQNGDIGQYLGRCGVTGKHRVSTPNGRGGYVSCTTWLLDDFGRARGERGSCGEDYAGAA